MATKYLKRKILIWGKTSPELSSKYVETVCTAGVLEDGSPVRLYPVPFRYLQEGFGRYQWIEVGVAKSDKDSRPESFKIDKDSIVLGEVIPTSSDEWGMRREWIFKNPKWHFESVETLRAAQAEFGTSLGMVKPKEIVAVSITERSEEEAKNFAEKIERLKKDQQVKADQLNFFEQTVPAELKALEFHRFRIAVEWKCFGPKCTTHNMQVLDWEVGELMRKAGPDKALQKVQSICNLDNYNTHFYLGNLFLHPTSFVIVGLWYPQRKDLLFT